MRVSGSFSSYVRTQPSVLFFDEFDAIGKERGDTHETGEIKRVVSFLLMQLDQLPSYVTVIAATNHANAHRSRGLAAVSGSPRFSSQPIAKQIEVFLDRMISLNWPDKPRSLDNKVGGKARLGKLR